MGLLEVATEPPGARHPQPQHARARRLRAARAPWACASGALDCEEQRHRLHQDPHEHQQPRVHQDPPELQLLGREPPERS
eukprot:7476952-Alexandrium_andersonii.AAC.1